MEQANTKPHLFASETAGRTLLRLAPPIMLAQLVQALYNIVDSYFVGKYSDAGLTALSLIYPFQLLITAAGIGTGVGVNTLMAKFEGEGESERAAATAKTGTVLGILNWIVFTVISMVVITPYLTASTASQEVRSYAAVYGIIVCCGSLGLFLESIWTKVHQAEGSMKRPMFAQIAGAAINIVLDPILIWGLFGFPAMGIAGAAVATVAGQFAAAFIVWRGGFRGFPKIRQIRKLSLRIYRTGLPSILMQSLYTFYVVGLNFILAAFSEAAVTSLGLYYKLQTFFFIPLFGLQNCIVPILSFNHAAGNTKRCHSLLRLSILMGLGLMALGTALFEFFPRRLLTIFTSNSEILEAGAPALRIIAVSFLPAVFALLLSVYFQATQCGLASLMLTLLRQVILLVPVAWFLSHFGLLYIWFTFPISELVTSAAGIFLYCRKKQGSISVNGR